MDIPGMNPFSLTFSLSRYVPPRCLLNSWEPQRIERRTDQMMFETEDFLMEAGNVLSVINLNMIFLMRLKYFK